MSNDEITYFTGRAQQEYAAARNARHPSAAFSHLSLAERYVNLVYSHTSVTFPIRESVLSNPSIPAFG